MATMKSKFRYMFDAAPSIALIKNDGVAKTATFNGDALVTDKLVGYWNPDKPQADQTFAIVVNVTDVNESTAQTAEITVNGAGTGESITLDDGTNPPITYVADTDFAVGVDDAATAANLAQAINDDFTANNSLITATVDGNLITVTNTAGEGGAITAGVFIASAGFTGGNNNYNIAVEVGPEGFATSTVLGNLPVNKPGQYVFLLDVDTAVAIKPDMAALRLVGTIAGADPSVTLFSWIAGLQR